MNFFCYFIRKSVATIQEEGGRHQLKRSLSTLNLVSLGIGCINGAVASAAAGSAMPFPLIAEDGNIRRIAHLEADAIRFAMQYYNGRMTEVARRLGIGRSTLYRKLNDLSIRHTEAA